MPVRPLAERPVALVLMSSEPMVIALLFEVSAMPAPAAPVTATSPRSMMALESCSATPSAVAPATVMLPKLSAPRPPIIPRSTPAPDAVDTTLPKLRLPPPIRTSAIVSSAPEPLCDTLSPAPVTVRLPAPAPLKSTAAPPPEAERLRLVSVAVAAAPPSRSRSAVPMPESVALDSVTVATPLPYTPAKPLALWTATPSIRLLLASVTVLAAPVVVRIGAPDPA